MEFKKCPPLLHLLSASSSSIPDRVLTPHPLPRVPSPLYPPSSPFPHTHANVATAHTLQVMDTRHTVDDMPEILQKLNSATKVEAVKSALGMLADVAGDEMAAQQVARSSAIVPRVVGWCTSKVRGVRGMTGVFGGEGMRHVSRLILVTGAETRLRGCHRLERPGKGAGGRVSSRSPPVLHRQTTVEYG